MERCVTCRHFEPDATHRPYGACPRWNQGYAYNHTTMPLNEVVVENDEGWAAVMGPEFGCVLHEPKP